MQPKISELVETTLRYLRTRAQDLNLTAEMLATIRPGTAPAPEALPVLSHLPGAVSGTDATTRPVVQALLDAAPHLRWRQTYSEDDGFDRSYLDRYGWIDLVADAGPYHADGFRVMAGYWGQGLEYPDHSHPPEEHYVVLSGGMWIRLADNPWEWQGPGGIFHVPAGAVHSASMCDGPLLALSIWRHEDLRTRINLTGADRNVALD